MLSSPAPTERASETLVVILALLQALTMPDRRWEVFFTAEGASHAFITGPDGMGMTDLGTLGGNDSAAQASTTLGQVGYFPMSEWPFVLSPVRMGKAWWISIPWLIFHRG